MPLPPNDLTDQSQEPCDHADGSVKSSGCDGSGDHRGVRGHRLYACDVAHKRFMPKVHAFQYKVFSLYLDLGDLPSANHGRLFGVNRRAIMSFRDKDHGPGDGTPVADWSRDILRRADLGWDESGLHLLCFPRMWGYVFNPLAIYYATNADGGLAGMLYQVTNTFGVRHSYVLGGDGTTLAVHSVDKGLHVSPFMDMDQRYEFRMTAPDERLSVVINEFSPEGRMLIAAQTGQAMAFTRATLMKSLVRYPLMSLKIMAAIHYEALHLWRKGIRFHSSPPVPETQVTYPMEPIHAARSGPDTQRVSPANSGLNRHARKASQA